MPSFTLGAAATTGEAVDNVSNWWNDPLTREWLIERPIRIAIIILIALIAHWISRRIIRKLADASIKNGGSKRPGVPRLKKGSKKAAPAEQAREDIPQEILAAEKTRENRRISRIKTLANVGRSAVAIFIWGWALLAILDKLGVNIAPLIASAGVVGVALGFGAQSLVKDFFSGIFMLIEDQYGIGDVIDVGEDIVGEVEDISLRLTTLRDIDGVMWFVRNGEILRIGNCSARYSITRLQIPVSLSANSQEARKVIHEAILEAIKHEPLSEWVIEEPNFQGVSVFDSEHIEFRCSITTLPGMHWDVERYLLGTILDAMNENNIPTPYPHGIGIHRPSDRELES